MSQLQAGYILNSIRQFFNNRDEETRIKMNGIFHQLSYFEVSGNINFNLKPDNLDPVICVANNIISRGLPTFPSVFVEDFFMDTFDFGKKYIDDVGSIIYDINSVEDNLLKEIYTAFHIIDPRVTSKSQLDIIQNNWGKLGSELERSFLYHYVPLYLGEEFIQLIEPQRDMESILYFAPTINEAFEKFLKGTIHNLTEQDVDFSLEFPYPINEKNGIVIEIDGSQHEQTAQKKLDEMRDDAIKRINWSDTLRIKTKDFNKIKDFFQPLKALKKHEYFSIIALNYKYPIYMKEIGLNALQLALSPISIARIQKCLIETILRGNLDISMPKWKILIIERDVPTGILAIEDFKLMLNNLFLLEGKGRKLPEIETKILTTNEFLKSKLYTKYESIVSVLQDRIAEDTYDLLIDHSVLQRSGIVNRKPQIKARYSITIQSSHGIKTRRIFRNSELIKYSPLIDEKNNDENEFLYNLDKINSLKYFLQLIFRKHKFKPGQIEILNRSLQCKNVVGLLPTGGGKSLAYQISALLQPGVCLIVDPIKSLMKDQYEGLRRSGIDGAVFINSSIKTAWEREKAADKMCNAEVLFTFISPERMQIRNFRDKLLKMTEDFKNYFSYCVVDEAHCVSEWGHDFRTSYLKLGENAMTFCKVNSNEINSVPLIGLTATASFDVLSDVQRELQISEESIITSHSLERPELIYKIKTIGNYQFDDKLSEKKIKQEIGETKQEVLVQLLEDIPFELADINKNNIIKGKIKKSILSDFDPYLFYSNKGKVPHSGLVFCPHKTWIFGVESVAEKIRNFNDQIKVGTFVGSHGEFEKDLEKDESLSEYYQEEFLKDNINLLVATKAFGMGIDKPNIRFTVHFNFPSSIESFYQEAGRAGRDGRLSICYILFSDNPTDRKILESFHRNSFKGKEKEKRILYEILKEITYPADSQSNIISESLREKIGIEANFSLWHKGNHTRLYINEAYGRGYGYIDLNTLKIYMDSSVFEYSKSQEVLEFVKGEIIEIEKSDEKINIINWLTTEIETKPAPGIELILNKVHVGERLNPIIVGFTNDKFKRITEYLKLNVNDRFTERIVKEATSYCNEPEDFVKNLKDKYYKYNRCGVAINDKNRIELNKLFPLIRDELDTYKAIYRLSIIGVVDDYEVDYNSKTIILHIRKKNDYDYIEYLHKYLLRYVSKERADLVLREVHSQKGNTIIQKCLSYLVDFVYQEIEEKRFNAIGEMERACIVGSEKGTKELKELIDIYFNSKYYLDLVKNTNKGKEFDFDLVIKYIDIIEGNIDNIKHLRGASTRLLIENPSNAGLILLKSFSLISLEHRNPDSRLFKEGIQSFHEGFNIFRNEKRWEFNILYESIEMFINELIKINSELRSLIELERELFFLRIHTNWITAFNKKFLENYERKHTPRTNKAAR